MHQITASAGARAVGPGDAVTVDAGEHGRRFEPPGLPGLAHRRYGDDVPQRGDASRVGAALAEGTASGGGRVEQGAAVDVVGKVPGRTLGHPGQFGVVGEVGARSSSSTVTPVPSTTRRRGRSDRPWHHADRLPEPTQAPRSLCDAGTPIAGSAASTPSARLAADTRQNLGPRTHQVTDVQQQPPDLPEQNAQDHNTRDASEPHPDPPHRPPPRPEPQAACGEDRSLYPKRRFL